jgi:prepilin-type processing-associated H-X9-DG protein
LSDIIKPVPSELFVFMDEHPDSINDGWMLTDVTDSNNWWDLPGSYHGAAGSFGFADGHAAIHKWREGSTAQPVQKLEHSHFPAPASKDVQWMVQHCSAPL